MSAADAGTAALIARLIALAPDERLEAVLAMSPAQREEFAERWTAWAHEGQLAPPGDWRVWLIRAGRGFGKTRAGAEWILALPTMVETQGATRDNPHLPASFADAMADSYAGTMLGRQELDGEMIDQRGDALWSRALIEARRVRSAPVFTRVVIGVDPPAGSDGDACGIVAVGRDGRGRWVRRSTGWS